MVLFPPPLGFDFPFGRILNEVFFVLQSKSSNLSPPLFTLCMVSLFPSSSLSSGQAELSPVLATRYTITRCTSEDPCYFHAARELGPHFSSPYPLYLPLSPCLLPRECDSLPLRLPNSAPDFLPPPEDTWEGLALGGPRTFSGFSGFIAFSSQRI